MLQQNSVQNYARPIASLILSAIKSRNGHESGYAIPLNAAMVAAFQPLIAILNASEEEEVPQDVLHNVLASLFLIKNHGRTKQDKWSSPVDSWIAAYMLREDGTFKSATEATQVLAKLMFTTKLTLFVEALKTRSEEESIRE